ncbi:MAG: hypothetical protein EOO15_05770 [Chitinophagaceae bacterium]|nr:MAG: hypothetical protein EOO15_05770 [Chitinophagaceae bacterium]
MRVLLFLLLFLPALAQGQAYSYTYTPRTGFAYRVQVHVSLVNTTKYGVKEYKLRLAYVGKDPQGWWQQGQLYSCQQLGGDLCGNTGAFYLAQVSLRFSCQETHQVDFTAEGQEKTISVGTNSKCAALNLIGIEAKVSPELSIHDPISRRISELEKQGTGSKGTTSRSTGTGSSGSGSTSSTGSGSGIAPPVYGASSTAEAWNQLYSAASGLGNLLADHLVEARQRREAQRLREWEKMEAARMKREAEERKLRETISAGITAYEPKAQKGDVYAMEAMGGFYAFQKNREKAIYWWERAATAGSISACERLVELETTRKERGQGFPLTTITDLGMRWVDSLIFRGAHEAAMNQVLYSYANHENPKRYDPKKALAIYEKFASDGNLSAMMKLGHIYSGEHDIDHWEAVYLSKDPRKFVNGEKALLYYTMLAKANDSRMSPAALRRMADMYTKGTGVKKDPSKAAEYESAATELAKKLGMTFYLYAEIAHDDEASSFTPVYTAYSLAPEHGGSRTDMATAKKQLEKVLADKYGWRSVTVTVKTTLQEAMAYRNERWKALASANHRLSYREDVPFTFDARKAKPTVNPYLVVNEQVPGMVTLFNGIQYKIFEEGSGKRPTPDGKIKWDYRIKYISASGRAPYQTDGATGSRTKMKDIPAPLAEVLLLMPAGSKGEIYIPQHLVDPKDYKFLRLSDRDAGAVCLVEVLIEKAIN